MLLQLLQEMKIIELLNDIIILVVVAVADPSEIVDPRSRSSQGSRRSPESKSRVADRDPKGASNPPEL
jgi:hypothetical protein